MKFGVGIFGSEPLKKIVAQVKLAEELGYESAWLIDSQLICREVYVTLAACAANTSRIKLCTGVTMPYTRHVSVTASAFATLNELARGRLQVGISIGNSGVRTLGKRPARIAELEECIDKLRGLLANEPVEFTGGVQGKLTWLDKPTNIPIYVAASSPKLTKTAGRIGDGALLLYGATPERIEKGVNLAREGREELGKGGQPFDIAAWIGISISPDRALAREHVSGRVAALIRHSDPNQFDEADREGVWRVRRAYDYYRHASAESEHRALVPDQFIDRYAVAGTPEEVREKVRDILNAPGFSQLLINPQVAGPRYPSVEQIFRDFAQHVMAHIS